MKKPKNKGYAHEVIRLAFFAREHKNRQIDDTFSRLSKPPSDKALHVRDPFVKIMDIIKNRLTDLDISNY